MDRFQLRQFIAGTFDIAFRPMSQITVTASLDLVLETYDGVLKGLELYFGEDNSDSDVVTLRKRLRGRFRRSTAPAWQAARAYDKALFALALQKRSVWLETVRRQLKIGLPNLTLENALNRRQMASKVWLAKTLQQVIGRDLGSTVLILGGWYGVLSQLLWDQNFRFKNIVSIDVDASATAVASHLNSHLTWLDVFTARTADMLSLEYSGMKPSLIVNTSCEHLQSFDTWFAKVPKGTLVVLQTNDYFAEPTHVNCVATLEDFQRQAPLTTLLFSGTLPTDRYNRFMIIGEK